MLRAQGLFSVIVVPAGALYFFMFAIVDYDLMKLKWISLNVHCALDSSCSHFSNMNYAKNLFDIDKPSNWMPIHALNWLREFITMSNAQRHFTTGAHTIKRHSNENALTTWKYESRVIISASKTSRLILCHLTIVCLFTYFYREIDIYFTFHSMLNMRIVCKGNIDLYLR